MKLFKILTYLKFYYIIKIEGTKDDRRLIICLCDHLGSAHPCADFGWSLFCILADPNSKKYHALF